MVTRVQRPRAVPKREISQARVTPLKTTIQRARERRTFADNMRILQSNVNNFINSVSNIENIESQANQYFNNNVNSIPVNLRTQFRFLISSSINNAKADQQRLIKQYTQKSIDLERKSVRAEGKGNKARERELDAQAEASLSILNLLELQVDFELLACSLHSVQLVVSLSLSGALKLFSPLV